MRIVDFFSRVVSIKLCLTFSLLEYIEYIKEKEIKENLKDALFLVLETNRMLLIT